MEEAEQSREDSFAFAARPAYAVQIRLTPELKQALQQAQQAGTDVSLRMRQEGPNQVAVLTIGGQGFFFSTANEGHCDIIQLPDSQQPGSECNVIGSVQQKLSLQRTLDAGVKSRLKARAEQVERQHKQRQTVLLDKQVVGGSKTAVTKTITRQLAPQAPKPPLAAGQRPGAAPGPPRTSAPQPLSAAPPVKKSLEPPKPNSKKPASASKPANTPPQPAGQTPPPPGVQGRPIGAATPCSQASTPLGTPPHGHGLDHPPIHASVAASLAAGGTGAPALAAPALPQQPQQPPEPPPKAAVLAAAKGDAQLCMVAIMVAMQPMRQAKLTNLFGVAYKMAKQKPEAKEYVDRVIKGSCDRVQPNMLRLKPEVQARDAPKVDALFTGAHVASTPHPAPSMAAPASAAGSGAAGPGPSSAGAAAGDAAAGIGPGSAAAAGQGAGAPQRNPNPKKRVMAGGRSVVGDGVKPGGSKKRSREAAEKAGHGGSGPGAGAGPGAPPPPPPPLQPPPPLRQLASKPLRSPTDSFADLGSDDDGQPMVINRGHSKPGKQAKAQGSTGAAGPGKAERPKKKAKVAAAPSGVGASGATVSRKGEPSVARTPPLEQEASGPGPGPGSRLSGEAEGAAAEGPRRLGYAYYMQMLEQMRQQGEDPDGLGAAETGDEAQVDQGVGDTGQEDLEDAGPAPEPEAAPVPVQGLGLGLSRVHTHVESEEEEEEPEVLPPAPVSAPVPAPVLAPPAPPPTLKEARPAGAAHQRRVVIGMEDSEDEQSELESSTLRRGAGRTAAQGPGAASQAQAVHAKAAATAHAHMQPSAAASPAPGFSRRGPGIPWHAPPPLSGLGMPPESPPPAPAPLPAATLRVSVASDPSSPGDVDMDGDAEGGVAQLGPPPVVSQGPSPQSEGEVPSVALPVAVPPPPSLRQDEQDYLESVQFESAFDSYHERYQKLRDTFAAHVQGRRPIVSLEQYEEYGREYRDKYNLHFDVHQECNRLLSDAEAYYAAARDASDESTFQKWKRKLWLLGAGNWQRLQRWQEIKEDLQRDLQGIRVEVEAYMARLRQQRQEEDMEYDEE